MECTLKQGFLHFAVFPHYAKSPVLSIFSSYSEYPDEAQLQAAAGAFAPPPPDAGAAASMNRAEDAPQANIELITEPQPPHKGSNIFRVKLTGANNSPISGAQVVVTFYMAAMPAMGMAAMNTRVTLTDKGNGMYEGKGDLASGGTWQVTITATQNGQAVASKHFTVNAEGGM